MKNPVGAAIAVVMLIAATVLQEGVLNRYTLLGAQANLPVVVVLCVSLVSRPAAGGAFGLLSGILTGGLSGATMMHYAVSRILGGYAIATRGHEEIDGRTAVIWVAAGTAFCQGILILLAPPNPLLPAVAATMLSAVYNGVAAIPVFALTARMFQNRVV
ncbi:MAG: hypothetical protein JNM28_09735 [Armatimonadetes bacterium]|nr:hypothetical protein [Armatimonadota bacterium]MBS1710658.1 hypothetical protein [Armatimonadota bacterium]MBX3108329.1 hypothetical protein [Fimbriimonadaceae bacterium]